MEAESIQAHRHRGTTQAENAAPAYRAALNRLVEGKATHPFLAGRPMRITPAAVARAARPSRNPLYTTHRSILDEIAIDAGEPNRNSDLTLAVARLKAQNTGLSVAVRLHAEEKPHLANENLLLMLHRAEAAEDKLRAAFHAARGLNR